MAEATLSSKHQIVIPREAREALGARPGDKLLIVVRGSSVVILPRPTSYQAGIHGRGRGVWPAAHVRKERRSWE